MSVKNLFMLTIGMIFFAVPFTGKSAAEPLNVVTTFSDFAAITKEIGGNKVTVDYLSQGNQDPHFVAPKPSLALKLKKADLFISIHVNGSKKTSAVGTSTHVLGLHRTNEQLEVAKKENSVILMEDDYSEIYEKFDPNSPESYIIFSLVQNVYLDQSLDFAARVQDQFRDRVNRVDRGVRQNGFLVLARSTMPGRIT